MNFVFLFIWPFLVLSTYQDEVYKIDFKLGFTGVPKCVVSNDNSAFILDTNNLLSCLNLAGEIQWQRQLTDLDLQLGLVGDVLVCKEGEEIAYAFDTFDGSRVANTAGNNATDFVENTEFPLDLWNGSLNFDQNLEYKVDNKTIFTVFSDLSNIVKSVFIRRELTTSEIPNLKFTKFIRSLLSLSTYKHMLTSHSYKQEFGADQHLLLLTNTSNLYLVDTAINPNEGRTQLVFNDVIDIRQTTNVSQFQVLFSNGTLNTYNYNAQFLTTDSKWELKLPTDLIEIEVDTGNENGSQGSLVKSVVSDWTLQLPGRIIDVQYRDLRDHTAQKYVKVSTTKNSNASKKLFKYLNRNLVAFASYDITTMKLVITLVDVSTGRVVSQATQSDQVLLQKEMPFNMILGEHWLMYTYYANDVTYEPKVSMWEMFESKEYNQHLQDPILPYVSRYTWTVPSRGSAVYSLQLSKTRFGAANRHILMAFKNQLVAFPKQMFNTLDPVPNIFVPRIGYLSYTRGVDRAYAIATAETNLESTYVTVALSKSSLFFTRAAPSGEFDYLSPTMPKLRLVTAVLGLVVITYIVTRMARARKLADQWR